MWNTFEPIGGMTGAGVDKETPQEREKRISEMSMRHQAETITNILDTVNKHPFTQEFMSLLLKKYE